MQAQRSMDWLGATLQMVARAKSNEAIAEVVVARLVEALDAQAAALALRRAEELRIVAARGPIDDAALQALGSESAWSGGTASVPMRVDERDIGVVVVVLGREATAGDRAAIESVAAAAALAIDRLRLVDDQRSASEIARVRAQSSTLASMAFLADAGAALTSSLDVEQTLSQVGRLAVPVLADWCAIDVLDEQGEVKRVSVNHSDPAKIALTLDLERRYPSDKNAPSGVPHVLRTGQTEYLREIPEAMLLASAKDEEHRALISSLGLRSYIVVPLTSHGRVLGALTLVQAESNRLYDEADVRLAEDLGRRAGQAVENAMLYRDAEVVHGLGLTLAAELDQEKLVNAVAVAATKLAGAQFGAFFYSVAGERGENHTRFSVVGAARDEVAASFAESAQGKPSVYPEEGVVRVADVSADPRYAGKSPRGMPGKRAVRSYLAAPVISRSGGVIGGLFFGHEKASMFTDRAERVVIGLAAQSAVAMDNARLFQKAEQLIKGLERSNAELDQFAYVTSHDLKAPLRGISNLATWIEEDAGQVIGEKSVKHLELMRGRIQRMDALIDGILNYSRAGRATSRPESIVLTKLATEVAELIAPKPPARIDVAANMPSVIAERAPLQQVLMNLVSNALKHAKRDDAVVSIAAADEGHFVEVAVTDNGPGIAPEFHERIWGIFQTLESRDKHESTGIGLAIVRRIVEQRGGRAWVESAAGSGATFKFRWPKRTDAEHS